MHLLGRCGVWKKEILNLEFSGDWKRFPCTGPSPYQSLLACFRSLHGLLLLPQVDLGWLVDLLHKLGPLSVSSPGPGQAGSAEDSPGFMVLSSSQRLIAAQGQCTRTPGTLRLSSGRLVPQTLAGCGNMFKWGNTSLQLSTLASSQQCLFAHSQVPTQASVVTNTFCSRELLFIGEIPDIFCVSPDRHLQMSSGFQICPLCSAFFCVST